MKTGHDKAGSFIVIQLQGLKKGHVTRIHNLMEQILEEELGVGERE